MNSKLIIFIIFFALGGFLIYSQVSKTNEDTPQIMEKTEMSSENNNTMDDGGKRAIQTPENAISYKIAEGSTASYRVQKRFLNKPDAEVIGTTDGITGSGWINVEDNRMFMEATIDLTGLKSDNEKRDKDIMPMFIPTTAEIKFEQNSIPEGINQVGTVTMIANTMLTINRITKEVPFEIEIIMDETTSVATGTSQIKMSDFGINPPSILNVYTVDDEVALEFKVLGEKL